MNKTITKEGVTYYHNPNLEWPRREDFFVVTGEIKFGGMYQDTGHYDEAAFQQATIQHSKDSMTKKCENRAGYYCKNKTCKYPKCLSYK
jgi:hypothetical protein